MDRDTIRDYLKKSDFTSMQADALSRLLSQTVTKEDLQLAVANIKNEVRESISSLRSELQESNFSLRSELQESISSLRSEAQESISSLRSEVQESNSSLRSELQESIHRVEVTLSRWMITILIALGGLITLLNYFLD